jgi:hypothetical protein
MAFRTLLAFWFFILFSYNTFTQPHIDLTEASLFLFGGATLQYDVIDLANPQQRLLIRSDVGGGYFIIDYLAIGLAFPLKWHISEGGSLGLKIFSTYFFDINGVVFPYVGGNTTIQYNMQNREPQLFAGIDGGVLVSLSESVALDFGLRPELTIKLSPSQNWRLSIPAGFLGIRAVF